MEAYKESSGVAFDNNTFHYDEKVGLALIESFGSQLFFRNIAVNTLNYYMHINEMFYQGFNLLNFIIALCSVCKTMLPSNFNELRSNLFPAEDLLKLIRSDHLVLDNKTIVRYLIEKLKSEVRQITVVNCHFSSDDNLDFTFDDIETVLFRNCTVELAQVLKAPATQIIVE
jgi:hypothetical protein